MTKLDEDHLRELRKVARGLERNLTLFIEQRVPDGIRPTHLAELRLLIGELKQAALRPNEITIDAIACDSFELITWVFRDMDRR